MGQLIRFSTTSFEAVRFSQNARLVPSDQVDIERRKAIARHNAFRARTSSGGASLDMNYINRVNKAFSVKKSATPASVPAPAVSGKTAHQSAPSVSHYQAAGSASAQTAVETTGSAVGTSAEVTLQVYTNSSASSAPSVESETAYTAQRGAFELRVAKGEISYVPAMAMTIITQYPEVNFEYLGGFNYVPPSFDPTGSNMNYTA